MKLYQGRIPQIAKEILEALVQEEDIEVLPEEMSEVELDIGSVLKEYLRVERDITDRARDIISNRDLPYNQLGKVKSQLAQERGFGLNDDAVDYITSQLIEVLLHSMHVEEVYSEDHELRRKMRPVLRRHMEVDTELDHEVRRRIKNLQEGTSTWETEYQKVMEDLKRTKKLD
jgi:hypothetical protein